MNETGLKSTLKQPDTFLMRLHIFLFFIAAFSTMSCSSGGGGGSSNPPYVCTTHSYPNGVTISGNADYEFRTNGNGTISGSPRPIRKAEVKIYSGNALIQCGATDDSGAFSFSVPQADTTHTVRVSSVIYNTTTRAYVMNNPSNRQFHYIETTFVPNTTKSVGTLTATAATNTALKGGAFNILDQIHFANEFLISKTANCANLFSTCPTFPGGPLVRVFWDKGLDPGAYVNATFPLSYYLPGYRELYILGGEDGIVDSVDCDHFDNSIILHEYGHFIEDVFSRTNSPGGGHDGESIIDARLAWGEGWANFFQAAVTGVAIYRDTWGNGGTTGTYFNVNLETPNQDIATTMGEGNFREFSISRLLWDAIDPANEVSIDDVESPFAELWTVFASPTSGFASSSFRFRNIGLFHSIQKTLPGGQDWSTLRTSEKHKDSQADYAQPVTRGASCSPINIKAEHMSMSQQENGSAGNSNQFASNDFYAYYHPGGAFSFALNYTTAPSPAVDLDVYIYPENYIFGGTAAAQAKTGIVASATSGSESININLAAGYYMINIRVNTTGGHITNTASYSMTLGGQSLCPN